MNTVSPLFTMWGPRKTRQMTICRDTPRADARRNQSPGEGRYRVARVWSRVSGGTPGKRTNKSEPRLRGDIMRGLNMGGTYNALIQSATLCPPCGRMPAEIASPLCGCHNAPPQITAFLFSLIRLRVHESILFKKSHKFIICRYFFMMFLLI